MPLARRDRLFYALELRKFEDVWVYIDDKTRYHLPGFFRRRFNVYQTIHAHATSFMWRQCTIQDAFFATEQFPSRERVYCYVCACRFGWASVRACVYMCGREIKDTRACMFVCACERTSVCMHERERFLEVDGSLSGKRVTWSVCVLRSKKNQHFFTTLCNPSQSVGTEIVP